MEKGRKFDLRCDRNEMMGQPGGHVQGAIGDAIRGGLRPGLSTADL